MKESTTHCIGINSEDIFVEGRVDTDDVAHLVVDLQLEWRHGGVKVHAVEVLHEEDLTVTLATVTRLRPLSRLADLHDDDVPARR